MSGVEYKVQIITHAAAIQRHTLNMAHQTEI